ncbi:MAG: Slp family lipoprotein [Nitrospiraceae bacterium]|nr:Slp family lipoprotein [Nitrospiraceae bacterium]
MMSNKAGWMKILLLAAVLAASGCAHAISAKWRQEAPGNVTFPMVLEDPDAYKGTVVVWGGLIIETKNMKQGTDIIVLETPLGSGERPESGYRSGGRFIARTNSYLDPAIYKANRKIAVAAIVAGKETLPLGQTQYTYPVVEIKQIHLFRKRAYLAYPPPPYWGWGWGWGGPYWYGGPLIWEDEDFD